MNQKFSAIVAFLSLLCLGPVPVFANGKSSAGDLLSGPDIIVGDITAVSQRGSSGTQVGLSIGITACNNGTTEVDFHALPNPDHPVVAQNLYRMSGGGTNDERFEQVGQSWLKHMYFALEQNGCGFGCSPFGDGTRLGPGCSDAESAASNGDQNNLGSRAWVNPFTGVFPGSNPNPDNHAGHTHTGVTHRVLVEGSDLEPTLNQDATYYADAQCITPHEYAWCQMHPGQCNMNNNVSYRQFTVAGTTTNFTFTAVGSTVRSAAITAWTGATINAIEPAPGTDGRALIGYKVTNPSAGIWHYEYAIYNENLNRAVQSFRVPVGCGITISNVDFHAPLNHPGIANDGTLGDAGFSNAPWTSNQTTDALTWNTETFVQNPNANAIRFGTLYNFRFDANRPPHTATATIGFFKTGGSIPVAIAAPTPDACVPLQLLSAVSRKTHGAVGDFDIELPLTGEPGVECRNGGGDYAMVIIFNNMMVSGNASVTSGTGSVAGSPGFSGNTMTVELTGVADAQRITVTLTGVTDSSAQVLPDTPISMNMLVGDTNGNKAVNAADVAQTKARLGLAATAVTFRSDTNLSGTITASDLVQVKASLGHAVP
jgi:hypothetical protein